MAKIEARFFFNKGVGHTIFFDKKQDQKSFSKEILVKQLNPGKILMVHLFSFFSFLALNEYLFKKNLLAKNPTQ